MNIAGLLLAAGAGRRMGTPKALVRDPDGVAWVVRAAGVLTTSGCSPVVVVVGAAAEAVRAELSGEPVQVVEATNWAEGMGASLRAGLTALQSADGQPRRAAPSGAPPTPALPPEAAERGAAQAAGGAGAGLPEAVVVVPVDVPGLTSAAVRRVADGADVATLARATYGGVPGHPVVIGRAHWDGVIATATGDEGARGYLRGRSVVEVECSDLGDGADVDTVEELPAGHG